MKNKYKLIIILSLIVILGGLSRLGLIDINSSYKIKVLDATNKMSIEGVPVFYGDSVSIPTPGGEVGHSIKQFDLMTNEEGEITIPFYINFKPIFGYDRRKYVRVNNMGISSENNEKNWFYQSILWVKLPIEGDIIFLERDQNYFNSLANIMEINTHYGFCATTRHKTHLTNIQQIYNPKNEEDLKRIPLYYEFRDIDHYTIKYRIKDIEYNCFLVQTDKPIFKISHHLLPAGDRRYYPEVAEYLYIDGVIYDGSETKLNEMNIGLEREDSGFFFFTRDIVEKVSKVENAHPLSSKEGPFKFNLIEEVEEPPLKQIEGSKKIKGEQIKILKNTIKDIKNSPFIIQGDFTLDKTADVYLDLHVKRFETLTNFELYLNDYFMGEEPTDMESVILKLDKSYTKEGNNNIKIIIKNEVRGGTRYPSFEDYPLTIYKDSRIISEGLDSANFEVIKS